MPCRSELLKAGRERAEDTDSTAILPSVTPRPAFRPNVYLLITVLSWGLNFVAIREIYKQLSPPAMALTRFLVMWGGLALVCLWRKESLRYPKEDKWRLLWLGFTSMGIYMVLFLEGMRGSAATEGSILLQTAPIFTALLAAGFSIERFSAIALIGAVIAFTGSGLVIYGGAAGHGENKLYANVLVVVSALCWAYCVTIMRPLLMKYSPLRVLTLSMLGGLPVMLIYGVVPAFQAHWAQIDLYGWAMFFHFAVISGIGAFLCFYQGVRQVGSSGATLYQYLVPPTTMAFALLISHEKPGLLQVAGLVVVLAGVAFATRARYAASVNSL